ncbi:hypothetical protein HPT29_025440 (plasmid) [Microvirga terrae]|uniref:DUF1579 domain-containing protein n=1 Tax=Microvirga terrae TaxID=2740529 RepID=A0ABY5RZN9_9HYPH|nr:hypothetical protein [Microvirga terrae]UVF22498.1 hypothetical protein HPT29_025440 [Microvirga terrae]
MDHIFTRALLSEVSHSMIPQESRIFEPFIGSWELVVSWFDDHGRLNRQVPGEWHFARVLEGRAIQDVWIAPNREERDGRGEYGTSLRFYDSTIGAWRSTWIGPVHGVIYTFIARRVGDQVILETTNDMALKMRWSFSEIGSNSFKWSNEVWQKGRWRTQQTFDARRVPSD